MHVSKTTQYFYCLLTCFILMVGAFGEATGAVICVAREHPIAVELPHPANCADDEAHHSHADPETPVLLSNSDSGCCGDCVDIPLNLDESSWYVASVNTAALKISVKNCATGLYGSFGTLNRVHSISPLPGTVFKIFPSALDQIRLQC